MNYYCTLFDSNYLTRGLTMYNSIVNTGERFTLYVFAFDDLAVEILDKLKLPYMIIISLKTFETEQLVQIKKERSKGEYCWTCTPFTIKYILDIYKIEEVTYVDADLYFFEKPEILLQEFRNSGNDVMITDHRYTPIYDQSKTSGIYCVQFMTFCNSENSLKVLKWWRDRCAEWCFNRMEDGKFGDQKYLDDWLERFEGIYVLRNIGGGVAPWNVQMYDCIAGPRVKNQKVVFYHFHALEWLEIDLFDLSNYKLNEDVKKYIYYPYIDMLKASLNLIRKKYDPSFSKGIVGKKASKGIIAKMRVLKSYITRKLRGCYNVVQR